MQRLTRRFWREDDGATSIMVALCMVVIMGMASLAIDVGAFEAKKSQVQDAADAAAMAIAQQCYANPATTTVGGCASAVIGSANVTATSFANSNVNDGAANSASATFLTASTVKVTVIDNQTTVFAKLFGITSSNATATATAEWGKSAIAWPLAYPSCAFPATTQNHILLRYDTLVALNPADSCGIITPLLGLGWTNGLLGLGSCQTDVNLLTYVGSITSSLVTIGNNPCDPKFSTLVGKKVLLPIYNTALGNVVIDGVLLNRFSAVKFAVVEVTGFDFSGILTLTWSGVNYKSNDAAAPACTGLLGSCQGIQGNYLGFVTPAQAKEMAAGVTLID